MRFPLPLVPALIVSLAAPLTTTAIGASPSPLQLAAQRVEEALQAQPVNAHNYKGAIAIEALIRWGLASDREATVNWAVERAAAQGINPGSQANRGRGPFNCLPYWLHRTTGDDAWRPIIVDQNRAYRQTVSRTQGGAIEHPRSKKRGGGQAMLIDALQDYASRMAMLGQLAGDASAFEEAVRQHRLYREVVRDPDSGLWHQGRGWLEDPEALSPGAWSRGHGWLIRGMIDTLLLLPPESREATELRGYLKELADALIPCQQPSGMWHGLLHRPPADSPPEASGTALIAGNLGIALAQGFLEGEAYSQAARKAYRALPAYVDENGVVLAVSPGPGPLSEEAPWAVDTYPPGDPHGPFAILFAALGEVQLDQTTKAAP